VHDRYSVGRAPAQNGLHWRFLMSGPKSWHQHVIKEGRPWLIVFHRPLLIPNPTWCAASMSPCGHFSTIRGIAGADLEGRLK
jgi:hypothetical protein